MVNSYSSLFDVAYRYKEGFSAISASILDTRCFTRSITGRLKNRNYSLLCTRTYIFHYGPRDVRWAQNRALFHSDA